MSETIGNVYYIETTDTDLFDEECFPAPNPEDTVVVEDSTSDGYDYAVYGAPLDESCYGPVYGEDPATQEPLRRLRELDYERAHTVAIFIDPAQTALTAARNKVAGIREAMVAIDGVSQDDVELTDDGLRQFHAALEAEAIASADIEAAACLSDARYHEARTAYEDGTADSTISNPADMLFRRARDEVILARAHAFAERMHTVGI